MMFKYPTKTSVQANVEKALMMLYKNDRYLVDNSVHEQALTHKLAEYLQQLYPEWNVDCEYNREEENRIVRSKRQGNTLVKPDIIIHHRGTHENFIVIEAKPATSSPTQQEYDKEKINKFLELKNFKYKYGITLTFKKDKPEYTIKVEEQ